MELLRGCDLGRYTHMPRLLPEPRGAAASCERAGAGAGPCPCAGRGAPRHQARQRHARPADRQRQAHRLRHRRPGRHEPHAHRGRARHAVLHGARTAGRRRGRCAQRPVLAGRAAVPAAERPAAARARVARRAAARRWRASRRRTCARCGPSCRRRSPPWSARALHKQPAWRHADAQPAWPTRLPALHDARAATPRSTRRRLRGAR